MVSTMRKSVVVFALAAVLALCAMPPMAFAAGGNGSGGGNGGGNGGGQSGPTLVASSPEDKASVEAGFASEMWLQFSNNVADASVCEENVAKVHLQKADGAQVKANVSVRDTATDNEHRQYIFLSAEEPLADSTTYQIVVDAGIVAKNGNASKEGYTVSFTTGESKQAAPAASSSNASATSAQQPSGSNSVLIIAAVAVAAVVIVAAGVVIARKRK